MTHSITAMVEFGPTIMIDVNWRVETRSKSREIQIGKDVLIRFLNILEKTYNILEKTYKILRKDVTILKLFQKT